MEKANVVLMEDGDETRKFVRFWLDKTAHTITREAVNLEEAFAAVEDIAAGELPCDVVVLDGNLDPASTNNEDAKKIITELRNRNLGVKVIDFASISLAGTGIQTDAMCDKAHLSELAGVIDAL